MNNKVMLVLMFLNTQGILHARFSMASMTITQRTHIDDKGFVRTHTTVVDHSTGKTTMTASPEPAELVFENKKQVALVHAEGWIKQIAELKDIFERRKERLENEWTWQRAKNHDEQVADCVGKIKELETQLEIWYDRRKLIAEARYTPEVAAEQLHF